MYIGAHASITPTILDGIKYIQTIGGTAIQIFAGNNHKSSLSAKKKITDIEKKEIKKYILDNDLKLNIHAIYLLNFCSFPPSSGRIKYAQDNLIYDLNFAQEIGGSSVVLHLGYQKLLTNDEAYNNMASNILHCLKETEKTAKDVKLLLETPACAGSQIGCDIEKLYHVYKLVSTLCKNKLTIMKRLAFCIDTAHIFSAGHDIRTDLLLRKYIQHFEKIIGIDKIALIHLNDSKVPLNSHRDIHEGIGDGYIFNLEKSGLLQQKKSFKYLSTLQELLKICKTHKIPIILETHSAGSPTNPAGDLYAQEIALLFGLAGGDLDRWTISEWKLKHKVYGKSKKSGKSVKNEKNSKKKPSGAKANTFISRHSKKISRGDAGTLMSSKNDLPNTALVNLPIINRLKMIQDYYNFVEVDRIRNIAYGKAIIALRNYPEEIKSGLQVKVLKGIGNAVADKIDQYLQKGEMDIITELRIPEKLDNYYKILDHRVESIIGIGPKRAVELKRKGIDTVEQLEKAVKSNMIILNDKEQIGLKYHWDLKEKIPRDETQKIFNLINNELKKEGINKDYGLRPEIAGSFPSGKKASKDIDILIITDNYKTKKSIPKKIMMEIKDILIHKNILLEVLAEGSNTMMCIVKLPGSNKKARHLDIRLLPYPNEIFARMYFTSGRDFNQMTRGIAKQRGFKLNEECLFNIAENKCVDGLKTEKDILEAIGLHYIPMEKRR